MNQSENFKFDVRIRERLLLGGRVTAAEVSAHLDGLPDKEDTYETIELEQPALVSDKTPPDEAPMAGIIGLGVPALSPMDAAPPVNPMEPGLGRHGMGSLGHAPKVSPFEPAPRVSALEPAPKVNPFEGGPVSPYEPAPMDRSAAYDRGPAGYPPSPPMPANPYEGQLNPYANAGYPPPGMHVPHGQHPSQGVGMPQDGRYPQNMPQNPYYPQQASPYAPQQYAPQPGQYAPPPQQYPQQGYPSPYGDPRYGQPPTNQPQHSGGYGAGQPSAPGIAPLTSGNTMPSPGGLGGGLGGVGMTSPMMNEPATSPMMPSHGPAVGPQGVGAPLVSPFEGGPAQPPEGYGRGGYGQQMPPGVHPGHAPQQYMPPQYGMPPGSPGGYPNHQVPPRQPPAQGVPSGATGADQRSVNPYAPLNPYEGVPRVPAIDPLKPPEDK